MFFLDGDRDAYERVLKERKETCDKNKKTLPSVWEGGRDPEQPSGSAGRVGPRRSIEDQKAHVPLPSHAAVHSASLLMPSDKRRIILPISRENPRFHQNHPLLPPLLRFFLPPRPHLHSFSPSSSPSLPLSLSLDRNRPLADLVANKSHTHTVSMNFSPRPVREESRRREEGGEKGRPERRAGFFLSLEKVEKVCGVGARSGRRPIEGRSEEGGRRRGAIVAADYHRAVAMVAVVAVAAFRRTGDAARIRVGMSAKAEKSRGTGQWWHRADRRPGAPLPTRRRTAPTSRRRRRRRLGDRARPPSPLSSPLDEQRGEGRAGSINRTRAARARDIEMSRGRKKN